MVSQHEKYILEVQSPEQLDECRNTPTLEDGQQALPVVAEVVQSPHCDAGGFQVRGVVQGTY